MLNPVGRAGEIVNVAGPPVFEATIGVNELPGAPLAVLGEYEIFGAARAAKTVIENVVEPEPAVFVAVTV
jgi:hypothetical protein